MRAYWSRRDGKWSEGYAVLNAGRRSLRVEWNLWARFCGVEVERTYENAWKLMLAFPPIALWVTFGGGFKSATEREASIRVHDRALWWAFWVPSNEWNSAIPRWRSGCWHPLDTLLGRAKYSNVEISKHEIAIPLPEGQYPATATLERSTWKRPRWFAKVRDFTKVDVHRPGGMPHEGKGENSWDCGTQGLCGYSVEGHRLEAAIARGVEIVLRERRRHDGNLAAKYPAPEAA